MTTSVIESVASLARRCPNQPAIIDVGQTKVSMWTWKKLWLEAERTAALLLHFGVSPGEVVAYQLPNRAEFVAITLGVLRLGAICCPLIPILRQRELAHMLKSARARVIFVGSEFHGRRPADELAELEPELSTIEHAVIVGGTEGEYAAPRTNRITWRWYHDALTDSQVREHPHMPQTGELAQLLFTSGTSGEPKGVLHRADVLTRAASLAIARLGLGSSDRIFVPSPLAHQTGFLYGMWLAFVLGVAQIVQEPWDPLRALGALREWRGTFIQAATPFLADLVQTVKDGAAPPRSLRMFIATGASVPRHLAERATSVLHTPVCGAFGTTEGCLATLGSPKERPEKAWGTDGRSLPAIGIRVCDDAGKVLPAGAEGHFQTQSPTMFACYLDRPDWTKDAYTDDGWYRTGDLAVIDSDGFLRVTGRVKDVINRGGEKIPVVEVEHLLYQHPLVQEVAIVAMPDERLVERACAFIVSRSGHSIDLGEVQAFLDKRRVAKQYWPERLEIIQTMPRTASGKIRKFVLRERAKLLSFQSGL